MKLTCLVPLFFLVVAISCTSPEKDRKKSLDNIADKYIQLSLQIGSYDKDFIDAYYGNSNWERGSKAGEEIPYEEFKWQANELLNALREYSELDYSQLELQRYKYLTKQVEAVRTKLDIMTGKILPFDVESLRLYDVVAPHIDLIEYDHLLAELDSLIPGEGALPVRYEHYAKEFIIPDNMLDTIFNTAFAEARKRTSEQIRLPDNEHLELEFIRNEEWPAHNWYKGNSQSVLQVNLDLPSYIERAVDLACHEGYPGHHVYNSMLEQELVNGKGWNEFQIYPLFSPQSFIAEGTAVYGSEIAFTKEERLAFEKEVLYPIAGINPDKAERYQQVQDIRKQLLGSEIQIARSLLNGEIDEQTAIDFLKKYRLYDAKHATARVKLYSRYRSYVINFSLGRELINSHIIAGTENENRTKWDLYEELLSTPQTASILQAD